MIKMSHSPQGMRPGMKEGVYPMIMKNIFKASCTKLSLTIIRGSAARYCPRYGSAFIALHLCQPHVQGSL